MLKSGLNWVIMEEKEVRRIRRPLLVTPLAIHSYVKYLSIWLMTDHYRLFYVLFLHNAPNRKIPLVHHYMLL